MKSFIPPVANAVPHLVIRYDQTRVKKTPLEVAQILRDGTPSIELNPSTGRKPARGASGRRRHHPCGGVDAAAGRRFDCGAPPAGSAAESGCLTVQVQ